MNTEESNGQPPDIQIQVAVDSSVLIGLLNHLDHWHSHSIELFEALLTTDMTIVYFDCVVAEAISAILRRLSEKGRPSDVEYLFKRLRTYVPQDDITWIFSEVSELYPDILDLINSSSGALNFHDALIALVCQRRQIPLIASYDRDFDQVSWLKRIAAPEDLAA